ncbi:LuxR family two component transcriptional regulator [Paraburkholderia sp. BL6665CI2N2]|uniref:response regulator n=1 Tax=Paraburkholderia sp. BL6665CI2N2 TaxID=1938806 RepID=UPI0010665197|nr:response regulator transcription factor [Paraburkholderia sp. BL6665CI2N2]TDY16668.1 LuxR family two component transcriptional regulator [Paraburkholderia sp. BL6665CI2N2]
MIHVLIANPHPVVRAGLDHIIGNAAGLVVSTQATHGAVVLELLPTRHFDLLLLDMSMPDINGVELTRRIRVKWPAIPILAFGEYNASIASRALRAGATGYIAKDTAPETLLTAIRTLASGGNFVEPRLVDALVFGPKSTDAPPHELISGREFQVLQMLAGGKRITEIAETLALSGKTVSTHKTRMMQKLCIANNSELIRYSIRHGVATR